MLLPAFTQGSVLSTGQQAAAGDPGSVALAALSQFVNPSSVCGVGISSHEAWAYLRNVSALHRLRLQILADVAPRAEAPVSCLLVDLSDIVI